MALIKIVFVNDELCEGVAIDKRVCGTIEMIQS